MELVHHCGADPAVLFSPAEMVAELQRWCVAVPVRKPDEPEALYAQRLRMVSDIIINTVDLWRARTASPDCKHVTNVKVLFLTNQTLFYDYK